MLHNTANSEQYIYDAKYRLVQFKRGTLDGSGNVTVPVTQTTYNLDALSNWTSKTTDGVTENRTHNNMNELVGIDGSPLTYDDNGNLIDDGTNTYEYDYENRLTRVTRKSDSTILGHYKYDALGRRVEKQASGTTTAYYYDENRVIEEQVGGSAEATYSYGIDLDEVVSMERGGQTYYYQMNTLGSVVALTNSSGSIAEHYDYAAYGESDPATSALGNPYMFTGRQLDQESSLQYNRNRYLPHSLGRWTTHDPLGYLESVNLYEYVKSNPVRYFDPFGEAGKEICCVKKLEVTYSGSSTGTNNASHSFTMKAEYEPAGTEKGNDCCSPQCCAFRQDIKGYYKIGGVNQPFFSSGSGLAISENTYVDDGYHNGDDFDTSDTKFTTNDNPGMSGWTGNNLDLYMNFRAKIIDTCNSNDVVKDKTGYWIRIQGKPWNLSHGGF